MRCLGPPPRSGLVKKQKVQARVLLHQRVISERSQRREPTQFYAAINHANTAGNIEGMNQCATLISLHWTIPVEDPCVNLSCSLIHP